MPKEEPVAITGMGAVCALGMKVADIERGLYGQERLLSPAAALSASALPFPFYRVPDAVWQQEGRKGSAADTLRLGLLAAREAMTQAQWTDTRAMAVIAGTTSGTALHFLEGYRNRHTADHCSEDCADYLACNPALVLGETFHAHGPLLTISNACTSGADAIGMGADLIRSARADAVLCGGMDALSLVPHTGFARLMVYDDAPCRPFDAHRKGLNLGEGAAFLCLESAKNAERRGVAILGYILGYGTHSDAYHFTAPHPEGTGLEKALGDALSQAGAQAADLAFVNVHGTGTRENDQIEGKTLARLLPGVPLWASKPLTGHTLGAAGALEAVFTLTALTRACVPASLGFAEQDPEIGVSPPGSALAITKRLALSTSLGFGGSNAALALAAGSFHD